MRYREERMRWVGLICAVALIPLAGCANLTSIARTTGILSTERDPAASKQSGTAIHLDAKQRLVFSDSRALCAEPSPDALSALAASAGAGATLNGADAASLATALQESSSSIGLRTQSITLMRDYLYRICEAYHNNSISEPDVTQLLQRSQDLTLGVLAIEQLTGAVAARQVTMGGGANSSASANLLLTQQQLENARNVEKRRNVELAAADKRVEKAKENETNAAEDQKENAKTLTQTAEGEQKEAKRLADEAKANREKIEENKDAAFSSASASANGSGQFASALDRVNLDKDSTAAIAKAVEGIVGKIVDKGYLTGTCVNFITNYPTNAARLTPKAIETTVKYCDMIITQAVKTAAQNSVPANSQSPQK